MRKILMSILVAIDISLIAMTSFAGTWKQEADGRWWYQNDDGSYPTNGWKKIDNKDYYFDVDGYMLHDTYTPDGYYVGSDGAWIKSEAASQNSTAADGVWTSFASMDLSSKKITPILNGSIIATIYNGNAIIVTSSTTININNLKDVTATNPISGFDKVLQGDNGLVVVTFNADTTKCIGIPSDKTLMVFKQL